MIRYFPGLATRILTAALRPADVGAGAEPEDHPLRLGAPLEVAGRLLAPLGAVAAPRRVGERVAARQGQVGGAGRGRRLRPDAEHEELHAKPIQQSESKFHQALWNSMVRIKIACINSVEMAPSQFLVGRDGLA